MQRGAGDELRKDARQERTSLGCLWFGFASWRHVQLVAWMGGARTFGIVHIAHVWVCKQCVLEPLGW